MTGQRVTRELLATLRPGDVVEVRSPEGSEHDVLIRGRVEVWRSMGGTERQDTLVIGDGAGYEGGVALSYEGNPANNVLGLELVVLSRVPRLYENSTRTNPAPGDVVRDAEGDVWHQHPLTLDRWHIGWGGGPDEGCDLAHVQLCGPLTLLWDGETGALPGASS